LSPSLSVARVTFSPLTKRSVGAAEILELELVRVPEGESAVHARHQRGVDDEVGPRRAAHGFQRAGKQPECQVRVGRINGLQCPHGW
jgi:hypothetical protein